MSIVLRKEDPYYGGRNEDFDYNWRTIEAAINSISSGPGGSITSTDISNWNAAYSWGNHALAGYLTKTIADTYYSPLGHNHTLDSLSNVTITSKATNDTIKWNGSAWINTPFPISTTGSGTTNQLVKFTGTTTIGNSSISDNGTIVSAPVEFDVNWIKFLTGINMSSSPTTFYNRIQRFNDSGLNADGIELEIRGAFNHINGGFRIKTGSNDVTVAPSTSFSIVQNTIRLGTLDFYTAILKGNNISNFQVYIDTGSLTNVDEVASFTTNSVTKPMIMYFNNVGDSPTPRYNSAIVAQYGGRFYDGTLSIFNQPNGTQGKVNMKRTIMFDRDNNVGIGIAYSDAPTLQYPTEYAQAKLHVKSNQTGIPTTIIQGAVSQTADLMQWLDSSNNVLFRIKNNGIRNGVSMTSTQISALTGVEGDDVYNTTTHRRNYFDGTIWRNFSDVPTIEVTSTSQSAAINNRYIANNASLVSILLPATAAIGDVIFIVGKGAGLWKLTQNAGQIVHGSTNTTTGTGGSVQSTSTYDCVEVRCITANTEWSIVTSRGTLTIV